jgi:transcriptional regulator GlxA family with amidase domain
VASSRPQRVVLVVAPHPVRMLDVAALLDAFGEANQLSGATPFYAIRMVSNDVTQNLANNDGFTLQAAASVDECKNGVDTLLVAGYDPDLAIPHREQMLHWLRLQGSQSRRIGSVSGGAMLLAEAGLLNGRRATIHWRYQQQLSRRYPQVKLEPDVIYVRDANVYTCAGAISGLDMALSMIEEDLGPAVAAKVAKVMLLSFRRSGASPQISAILSAQEKQAGPIANLLTWLPDNLQRDLSIKVLAKNSAMSARNFARTFRREVGVTPARHIESLRLETARFKLESTSLTIDEVAFAAGFESSETLRRVFARRLNITPGRYRAEQARFQKNALDGAAATGADSETKLLHNAC